MTRTIDIINETLRLAGVPMFEEAESPAFDKSAVKIAKPTQSKGWKEVSTKDIKDKANTKGEVTGLPEFKFGDEASLSDATKGEKKSEPKQDSPAMKGSEPKVSDVEQQPKESKVSAPKTEESKSETPSEEKEESKEPEDKEKKKEEVNESVLSEGPFDSLNPIKAAKNFKKGLDKKRNIKQIVSIKDGSGKTILDYIQTILLDDFRCGYDSHGLYIASLVDFTEPYNLRDFGTEINAIRTVGFNDEKYGEKAYLPKLTDYIEKHHSLPSEKQLRTYLTNTINNRFKKNYEEMQKKNPKMLSKTDVEEFNESVEGQEQYPSPADLAKDLIEFAKSFAKNTNRNPWEIFWDPIVNTIHYNGKFPRKNWKEYWKEFENASKKEWGKGAEDKMSYMRAPAYAEYDDEENTYDDIDRTADSEIDEVCRLAGV